jgi:hypothetical protein
MTDFDPPSSWAWAGPFLWLTVHYGHRFEAFGERRTRLVWTVAAEGRGVTFLGRLFAAVYARNLDRAIPNLQRELDEAAGPA